jgi:hypothetical protein
MPTRPTPRQAALFPRSERTSAVTPDKSKSHHERDREAGAIILADPERYGGVTSLPVLWANLVLSRQERD